MVSSSSGRITFGGIASGIDTNSIVSQLIAIQRRPIFAIMDRADAAQAKINAYNSLIVHALTVVGPAETTLQRLTWFGRVAYRIGGTVFSADDIEHGVLRGNASPPASFLNLVGLRALAAAVSPAFGPSDPRRAYSLARDEVDPRIHFALYRDGESWPSSGCNPAPAASPARASIYCPAGKWRGG